MPGFFNGSSDGIENNQQNIKKSNTRLIGFLAIILLLIALPIVVIFSRNTQETRQRAAGVTPQWSHTVSPTIPSASCSNTVTLDAKSSTKGENINSIQWSHTVAENTNTILLVGTETMGGDTITPTTDDVTSVTYDGQALTKAASNECGDNRCSNAVWYMVNPPVGTFPVVATMSKTGAIVSGAASFFNVDQTNPLGKVSSANGVPGDGQPKITATTTNGQLVFDSAALDDDNISIIPHQGQSVLWNIITQKMSHAGGASTIPANDGSTAIGWTVKSIPNEEWSDIAAPMNPTTFSCSSPTPSVCVTPGPVNNVQIICANCGG